MMLLIAGSESLPATVADVGFHYYFVVERCGQWRERFARGTQLRFVNKLEVRIISLIE
jgi:hypothetical protein